VSRPAAPEGLAARAHPFTPIVATFAVVALAFVLPAPAGPATLALLLIGLAPLLGDTRALIPAAWLALPFWVLLFLLHGLLGEAPFRSVGPFSLSIHGMALALTTAARLTAVIVASVLLLRGFRPGRFVDAALARGWSWTVAYLAAASLTAIPRFHDRAVRVRDAMRSRGLRVGGNLVTRSLAFVPLALPLMLGALHDVDERAFALATRQARLDGTTRTPLRLPEDPIGEQVLRWGLVLLVGVALAWRVVR
jgi:energy-coupling factor transport system permease protein